MKTIENFDQIKEIIVNVATRVNNKYTELSTTTGYNLAECMLYNIQALSFEKRYAIIHLLVLYYFINENEYEKLCKLDSNAFKMVGKGNFLTLAHVIIQGKLGYACIPTKVLPLKSMMFTEINNSDKYNKGQSYIRYKIDNNCKQLTYKEFRELIYKNVEGVI